MPVTRIRGGEVAFVGRKWISEAGKVTPNGIRGLLGGACRVPFDPFSVGRGGKPVNSGLPVPFKKGRADVFRMGNGNRPVLDALKLVVKFTVGKGKKPELGCVG